MRLHTTVRMTGFEDGRPPDDEGWPSRAESPSRDARRGGSAETVSGAAACQQCGWEIVVAVGIAVVIATATAAVHGK